MEAMKHEKIRPYGRADSVPKDETEVRASCREGVQKKTKIYIDPSKTHDATAKEPTLRSRIISPI